MPIYQISLRGEYLLIATYLINLMLMSNPSWQTLHEMLYKSKSSYDHLRTMGCLCFIATTTLNKDKFDPIDPRCIFLGYGHGQKGYT